MDKIKRNERLGVMTKILMDTPNRIHTLSEFCEMFGAAKSTISEDIDLVSASLERFDLGQVQTITGAAGGVRYRAVPSAEKGLRILDKLCERLSEHEGADIYLVGDGYEVARRHLISKGIALCTTPITLRNQNAASVALVAERMLAEGNFCSDREISPSYLRLPQAERERLEKERAKA